MEFWNEEFCQRHEERHPCSDDENNSILYERRPYPVFIHKNLEQLQETCPPIPLTKIRHSRKNITLTRRQAKRESFMNATMKIKKMFQPKMQLAATTASAFDDLINHVIQRFDEELTLMNRKKESKTLTLKQLETATKLCFPKKLQKEAIDFGYFAVQEARRNMDK